VPISWAIELLVVKSLGMQSAQPLFSNTLKVYSFSSYYGFMLVTVQHNWDALNQNVKKSYFFNLINRIFHAVARPPVASEASERRSAGWDRFITI